MQWKLEEIEKSHLNPQASNHHQSSYCDLKDIIQLASPI